MHVKENTALSSTGDVEMKEVVDESGITATSVISQTSTSSSSFTSSATDNSQTEQASEPDSVSVALGVTDSVSTAPSDTDSVSLTQSVTDCVSLTHSVSDSVSLTQSVSECVSVSQRLLRTTVESDSLVQSNSPTQSVTESVSSTRSVAELVKSTQSVTDIVRFCKSAATASNGASMPTLDTSIDGVIASDSAVETDDSCHDDMVIDAKDIKQELDSEGEDVVDGHMLGRLREIDLKVEPDSNSNSSSSFNHKFWNGESDASMRKRLLNSLSQSFPGSALSRVLHSMDTEAIESDDEDLVPSADRLSSSCFGSIRLDKEDDDDLTSLSWLQDSDLLKNINADLDPISEEQKENAEGQKNGDSGGGSFVPQTHPCHVPYNPLKHVNSKPPYSFSCLIFMAVEAAPGKKLPVKDIYNWILTNFPYFQNAPTGWKNSVRHNLSLNKCFKKVDKDKGANIGKGSLWCIDPEFRPNLLQALRKTPYHPYQQLQMMSSMVPQQQVHHVQGLPSAFRAMPLTQRPVPNTVSPHLFPFLSRRLAQSNVDREMQDVANVLVSLSSKNSSGMSSDASDASGPVSPRSRMKRKIYGPPKRQGPFIITPAPCPEHNYSSPKVLEEDAASGTSSIDNEYDFGDNDDISEPSDYPSDWDDTSGDEVDGDLPEQPPRKRLKMDMKKDEESKVDEGAKLLMSFAGWATYSDEEEKQSPVKSSSSSSCTKARSFSTKSHPRSSSASPLAKRRTSTAASKSSSSLSSSQSSTSSSRSSTTKSTTKPVSRSALKLKSKLLRKTPAKSSSASKSSGSAPSKTSSSSKPTAVSVSKSPTGASPQSLKKPDSTTPPLAKPLSTPESSAKSSSTSTPSSIKSSIIMTRRGKAAAAAEAAKTEAAKTAALATKTTASVVHSMRTRGKKLHFS
ncbi:uncharacterized protein LOC143296135 [Babylonia areolata]|uniref:uncharacterized protein LOC143296135 n=1 Tax=Babylonia areolata TaxID=304850 RepID=UPI003FCF3AB8